jgi:hypothetical protein
MADHPPLPGSFAYLLDQTRSTYWMRGPLASGWWAELLAVPSDEAVEAWTICARMHLLSDPESPDDVLPVAVGSDRKLERYSGESATSWRSRGLTARSIYALGGTEAAIESQIDAAGYGPANKLGTWGATGHTWGESGYAWGDRGVYVEFRPDATGPRGESAPYRTQFWVRFANGYHPITGQPVPWGLFPWDGNQQPWGAPAGFTLDFHRTITGIVRKWKDPTYVFRGYSFQIGSLLTWGQAGHQWGEAGQVWGGAIEATFFG